MKIHATGTLNRKNTKALFHFLMYKKAHPKTAFVLISILFALLAAINIFLMLLSGTSDSLFTILLCALICLLNCYIYFILPKLQYNALGKLKDITNEYTFCDNEVIAVAKNAEYSGVVKLKYSLIFKAAETSQHFFIYENKSQVFIVDKSTLLGGTAEDIKNKLMPLLGKKYMLCNY